MHDFNNGDIVILRGPVTNRDQEEFRGGWIESGMREWVGLKAKVLDASFSTRCQVKPCTSQGITSNRKYWWDINYMDHFYEMKEVSAEEYTNVLFEG